MIDLRQFFSIVRYLHEMDEKQISVIRRVIALYLYETAIANGHLNVEGTDDLLYFIHTSLPYKVDFVIRNTRGDAMILQCIQYLIADDSMMLYRPQDSKRFPMNYSADIELIDHAMTDAGVSPNEVYPILCSLMGVLPNVSP